jgi:NAD(P)-dependent dehydrogenase (short-subunit alcohol dehydrogenase family)
MRDRMIPKDKAALVTGTSPNIGGGIAEGAASLVDIQAGRMTNPTKSSVRLA